MRVRGKDPVTEKVSDKSQRKALRSPNPASKKAWQKPRVKSGQLFESNSLACGKNAPIMDQCIQIATQS